MATHGLMLVERSIVLMVGTEKLDTNGKVLWGLEERQVGCQGAGGATRDMGHIRFLIFLRHGNVFWEKRP